MNDDTESERRHVPGVRHRRDPVFDEVIAVVAQWESEESGRAANVVDVGGGSGAYAVQIASRGHHVTVVDPSANALATLERRAADAGVGDRIVAAQGDIDGLSSLVSASTADLVLCHGVLEVVDNPTAAMRELATIAVPGAAVSIVVANRHGAVAGRVIAGRLAEALAILQSSDGTYGPADPLPRRFTVDAIRTLLTAAGLVPSTVRGVRTFGDVVGDVVRGGDGVTDVTSLATIDDLVAGDPAFQSLAPSVHIVAGRP